MKNIHILPTDKPTRLFTSNSELTLADYPETTFKTGKNIYITSNEEIKEGDWCYYLNRFSGGNMICQAYKHKLDIRMLFAREDHNRDIGEGITPLEKECKKIILTTDLDLIKDGVQLIPDEFLEWFVKNPNCEEVETLKFADSVTTFTYKIIIPKEEPKQECEYIKEYGCIKDVCSCNTGKFIKQETLEEAADNWVNKSIIGTKRNSFIEGAKWQQERSYSEEEVFNLCREFAVFVQRKRPSYKQQQEWFEQFKKE